MRIGGPEPSKRLVTRIVFAQALIYAKLRMAAPAATRHVKFSRNARDGRDTAKTPNEVEHTVL